MIMNKHALVVAPALLALAACQAETPAPSAAETSAAPAAETSTQPSAPAKPLEFETMTYDEFSPLIESGTGCSFSTTDDILVLVSTAEVRPDAVAKGVVKLNGEPQVVTASESGGYEALMDGASFTGADGLSITVTRTSDIGTTGEIETTSWPATLMAERSDGGTASYEGIYGCGA